MQRVSALTFLVVWAGLLTLPGNSTAQDLKDFTTHRPTTEELVETLTPRMRGLPSRGIELTSAGGSCEGYQQTRGVMPVAMIPVADIAAIRVTFAFNSNALTPESVPTLKALGEALKSDELASGCIQIEGHTDSKGSDSYNRQLSQRRARSVMQYLVQKLGVPQDRLIPVGKGESEPIADNGIDAGRQKNRRVQIVNLGYPKAITLEGR